MSSSNGASKSIYDANDIFTERRMKIGRNQST